MNPEPRILLFVILSTSGFHCHAEPLGRLFLTPEQRTEKPIVAARPTPAKPTINGIIRSQSGSGTIWINGRAQKLIAAETTPQETGTALSKNAAPEAAQ